MMLKVKSTSGPSLIPSSSIHAVFDNNKNQIILEVHLGMKNPSSVKRVFDYLKASVWFSNYVVCYMSSHQIHQKKFKRFNLITSL